MTKDQAYLVLIMFKAQNYDRLVSDFVELGLIFGQEWELDMHGSSQSSSKISWA